MAEKTTELGEMFSERRVGNGKSRAKFFNCGGEAAEDLCRVVLLMDETSEIMEDSGVDCDVVKKFTEIRCTANISER